MRAVINFHEMERQTLEKQRAVETCALGGVGLTNGSTVRGGVNSAVL